MKYPMPPTQGTEDKRSGPTHTAPFFRLIFAYMGFRHIYNPFARVFTNLDDLNQRSI